MQKLSRRRRLTRVPELRRALGVEEASRRFLLYFVMPPLPTAYIAVLGTAITAFIIVPYGEELWRCWKVDRSLEPAGGSAGG